MSNKLLLSQTVNTILYLHSTFNNSLCNVDLTIDLRLLVETLETEMEKQTVNVEITFNPNIKIIQIKYFNIKQ